MHGPGRGACARRRQRGDVLAVQQHAALAGGQLARDQVEVGRLARAVGPDDGGQRARPRTRTTRGRPRRGRRSGSSGLGSAAAGHVRRYPANQTIALRFACFRARQSRGWVCAGARMRQPFAARRVPCGARSRGVKGKPPFAAAPHVRSYIARVDRSARAATSPASSAPQSEGASSRRPPCIAGSAFSQCKASGKATARGASLARAPLAGEVWVRQP